MLLTSKLTSKRQVLMKKLIYPGSNQIIDLNYEEIEKSEKALYILNLHFSTVKTSKQIQDFHLF